ncbi:MAG: PQQ-dependent sugar dehydrogenase [Bacteroidota bacterium]
MRPPSTMPMLRLAACCAVFLLAVAPASGQVTVSNAFPGVSFDFPVDLAMAPGQQDRVYVVEQGESSGLARVMTLETGDSEATVFLDIDDRVLTGGEQGLLGLAFHPDYETNGRFFVSYTASNPRRSVISEFARDERNPLTADPASEQILLEEAQPFGNHNGGKIAFGPDGFLYFGIGDGGSADDPLDTGQDLTDLLGALLRIDVDNVPDGETYGIPDDNPFAMTDGPERDELFAWGLRNPWKFSFDSQTGDLWLGDVGQDDWEEINRIENGGNYGWRPVEGPECFEMGCDLSAYDAPVFSYPHGFGPQEGSSITGGFVYRGTEVAGLDGFYLYGDFSFFAPKLWVLAYDPVSGDATSTLVSTDISGISSINEGPSGEAYILSYGGTIYTLGGAVVTAEAEVPGSNLLRIVGPNPVRGETTLALASTEGETARVSLLDALGREVAVLHEGPVPTDTRLQFEASAFASGLYLVRVTTPTKSAVRRLVVTR